MIEQLTTLLKSNAFKQLIKYGVVGLVGLVIDMGLFWILNDHLKIQYSFTGNIESIFGGYFAYDTINTSISHIISSVIAITNNFILNSYFTFKVTDQKVRRFLSFFGIAAVGLAVSTSLLLFFVEVVGFPDMLAKFVAVIIVAMLQFGFNKFFTFKRS